MNVEQTTAMVKAPAGAELAPISDRVRGYIGNSRADNTQDAYRRDWQHFSGWCEGHGLAALPAAPQTVADYLADLAEVCKPSTLQRRLSSIAFAHRCANLDSPTHSELVRSTARGIRRVNGVAPDRKKPVRVADLRRACAEQPETLQGLRDRALLLAGYAGAFRRSELAALTVGDVEFVPQGFRVTVRRSKTDQDGAGMVKAIGYGVNEQTCPVRALQAWLAAAAITEGPIFRPMNHERVLPQRITGKGIALVVKRMARELGLPEAGFSGHSLRAGFVTDQYAAGTAEQVIMQQTGHRSAEILGVYRREADLFSVNFTAAAGL
jgi:site-specific recombinase XerD